MEKKIENPNVDTAPTAFYEFKYGGMKYYINPLKTLNIYDEKTESVGIIVKQKSDYYAQLEIKQKSGISYQTIKLDPKIWSF